jgi:NADPH2:quinone reductase
VSAAVGSDEKRELPRSLGADPVVTYAQLDDVGRVDVVFDPVGGELFTRLLGLLKPLGTAIAVGFAAGPWQPLDTARLVGRNSAVAGFYLGRMMHLEPETVRIAALDVLRLWENGSLHPVVGARFPLVQAAAALDFVESRQSTGKVVLIP